MPQDQLSELRERLEEKSHHVSKLEAELQELSHYKEEKLKLCEENAILKNQLRILEEDLKESLKQNELQSQKAEHIGEMFTFVINKQFLQLT